MKRSITGVIMTALLLCYGSFCPVSSVRAETFASVSGYIHNSRSKAPVPGAILEISDKVVIADTNGYYTLEKTYTGKIIIKVRAEGYETLFHETELEPGQNTVNLSLMPVPEATFVSGKILSSATNTGVAGAMVYLGPVSAITDAGGYFEMPLVPSALHKIVIHAKGYRKKEEEVAVAGEKLKLEYYIEPDIDSSRISGRITDALNGNPVSMALVKINDKRAITCAEGKYEIINCPSGKQDFSVEARGYLPYTGNIRLRSGENRLDIELIPKKGSLKAGSGEVNKKISKPGPQEKELLKKKVREAIAFEGFQSSIDEERYNRKMEELAGARKASLTGMVMAGDGTPLEKIKVRIGDWTVTTDREGAFSLSELSPGYIDIEVKEPGYREYSRKIYLFAGGNVFNIHLLPSSERTPVIDDYAVSPGGHSLAPTEKKNEISKENTGDDDKQAFEKSERAKKVKEAAYREFVKSSRDVENLASSFLASPINDSTGKERVKASSDARNKEGVTDRKKIPETSNMNPEKEKFQPAKMETPEKKIEKHSPARDIKIEGSVIEKMSGETVGGASFIFGGKKIRTDRAGSFQIRGLIPGKYRLEFEMPGYEKEALVFFIDGRTDNYKYNLYVSKSGEKNVKERKKTCLSNLKEKESEKNRNRIFEKMRRVEPLKVDGSRRLTAEPFERASRGQEEELSSSILIPRERQLRLREKERRAYIKGVVIDRLTRQPVAGATVSVDSFTMKTGNDGRFYLDGVTGKGITLSVAFPGYDLYEETKTVSPGENIFRVELSPSGIETAKAGRVDLVASTLVEVRGRVTDRDTGAPVPSVAVVIGDRSAVTDRNGYYNIKGLSTGLMDISVISDSHGVWNGQIEITSGITIHDIQMKRVIRTGRLKGKVFDEVTKLPVSGGIVNTEKSMVRTDGKGEFEMVLPYDYYTLTVKVPGYMRVDWPVSVAGPLTVLNIGLEPLERDKSVMLDE